MKWVLTEKAVIAGAVALFGGYNAVLISGFYWQVGWLDIPLHAFGGFVVAQFFAVWLRHTLSAIPPFAAAVFILGAALLVGMGWEWFEWIMDHFVLQRSAAMQATVDDTLLDLFMDTVGAGIVALIYLTTGRGSG